MSNATASADTFASGRYSKRKRTQVTYHLDDLDYSDTESDFESPQTKVRRTIKCIQAPHTNASLSEAQSNEDPQTTSQAQNLPLYGSSSRDP